MSRSSRQASSGFSPMTMVVIVLVGIVSLAGLGVLSAYAPELKSGDNGGGHALSRAATGYGALPILLREMGAPVGFDRGEAEDADERAVRRRLLILTPAITTDAREVQDLIDEAPSLIVLPKWVAAPYPGRRGWTRTVDVYPPRDTLRVLPPALRGGIRFTERKGWSQVALRRPNGEAFGGPSRVERLRTFTGPGWTPVVVDEQGRPVLLLHQKTYTYVLTDPDFVSTHALKTLTGARTAVSLINLVKAPNTPVVFDLTLHGFQKGRQILRLLLEPPLLGMTVALVALAAFAGLQAAVRFGPARENGRAIALGKRALAENTASLVRMARREHHMAAPYALLVRAAVARAIGAPRTLSDGALDAFLDRVSRIMGATDTYTALAHQARTAKTPGDLMRVAGALYRWNQELTRARQ
jgi:hypothetical protein